MLTEPAFPCLLVCASSKFSKKQLISFLVLIVATRSAAEVSEEAAVPEGVLARHGDGAVGVNLGGEAPRHEVHRRPVAEVLADAVHLQLGGRHGALALARRVGE